MMLIAAKHLIGAITPQRDRTMFSDQPAYQESRYHRGVADRFVVLAGKHAKNLGSRVAGLEFNVVGAEVISDKTGVIAFVIFGISLEPDRKCLDVGHCA